MSRLVSLFSNQEEAAKAVSALADSSLGEHDVHLIEEWQENSASVESVPAPVPSSGSAGTSVLGAATVSLSELDDEGGFLRRSVQKGGILIVVNLSDDADISLAEHLVEESGGQLV